MASKRQRPNDTYEYNPPVLAVTGRHGELSAVIERLPDGWHWQAMEDGAPFHSGQMAGLEDAESAAVSCLNRLLQQHGSQTLIIDVPSHWVGRDRPKSLVDKMSALRPKPTPLWKRPRR